MSLCLCVHQCLYVNERHFKICSSFKASLQKNWTELPDSCGLLSQSPFEACKSWLCAFSGWTEMMRKLPSFVLKMNESRMGLE